jgi:hypothetical protein
VSVIFTVPSQGERAHDCAGAVGDVPKQQQESMVCTVLSLNRPADSTTSRLQMLLLGLDAAECAIRVQYLDDVLDPRTLEPHMPALVWPPCS